MPRPEPRTLFIIRESNGYPGMVSISPYPTPKLGTETIQSRLTEAGFKVGDVVEVRIDHQTRIRAELPPPGQLRRRSRGKR